MRFCDFFAGIGGFRIGLEQAGHEAVWACEINRYCRQIYAQHFEEPKGRDIADVKPEEIPEAELWTGGFPCQDLSVAGKGEGIEGKKSGVYWAWHRLIEECRPPWLLIENVPGLLSGHGGRDFQLLLSSLTESEIPMPGFGKWPYAGLIRGPEMEVSWRVLDAQHFGLAQRRERVFIIRSLGRRGSAEVLFECESLQRYPPAKREAGSEIAGAVEGCANSGGGIRTPISHALTHRTHKGGDPTTDQYVVAGASAFRNRGTNTRSEAKTYVVAHAITEGVRKGDNPTKDQLVVSEATHAVAPTLYGSGAGTERTASAGNEAQFCIISPYPLDQERGGEQLDAESEVVRAVSGAVRAPAPPDPDGVRAGAGIRRRVHTPDSPRYKALGNAVAVPVIKWIGDRLRRYERVEHATK